MAITVGGVHTGDTLRATFDRAAAFAEKARGLDPKNWRCASMVDGYRLMVNGGYEMAVYMQSGGWAAVVRTHDGVEVREVAA